MKKILLCIYVVFMSMFINAANSNLQVTEVTPGIISIVWQADTTLSFGYDIMLAQYDEANNSANNFAEVAGYDYSFAIEGYPGYLICSTNIVLQYGENYSTIGANGASDEIVAAWQTTWETCVADETLFTLNPGLYVIFVKGVNENFETTEDRIYKIAEVASQSQDITQDINIVNSNNITGKYLDANGKLYILKNGKMYNMMGNKIK